MLKILDRTTRTVTQSTSIIGFSTTGSDTWKVWDRYLTVNEKPAYHLGNICGTCSYLFERMDGANAGIEVGELTDILSKGLQNLQDEVVDTIAQLLPPSSYHVALFKLRPERVQLGGVDDYFATEQVKNEGEVDSFWGLPHYPKVRYCRVDDRPTVNVCHKGDSGEAFNFLVPMFPDTFLDPWRIAAFEDSIQGGLAPTAISISVLDVKGPACTGTDHWCMAHFILDGHHKIAAAARDHNEITLIAFIAVDHGISSEEHIDAFLSAFEKEA